MLVGTPGEKWLTRDELLLRLSHLLPNKLILHQMRGRAHNISAPVLPLFLDHDPRRNTLKQIVSDANLFVHL